MLKKTFNYVFTCDRCGTRREYTHFLPDWRPMGWREVTGRNPGRDMEPQYYCPMCSNVLFEQPEKPETKPEPVHDFDKLRIKDDDGHVITYKRDSDSRTYWHNVDDDDEGYIGLTD